VEFAVSVPIQLYLSLTIGHEAYSLRSYVWFCFVVIKGVVGVYERRDAGQSRESSVSVVTASTD